MQSISPNEEFVLGLGEFILVNKGEVNLPFLTYKSDEWWLSGELDIEAIKRAKSLGFPKIFLLSIAITHKDFLVFNWNTRALVHNRLLATMPLYGVSPYSQCWPNDLERYCIEIKKELTLSELQSVNAKLISINNKMNELTRLNTLLEE